MSRKKKVGVIGALLGVAAAGVAAGVAAERVLVRRTRRVAEDPCAGEPFDRLPFDEQRTVVTEDDVDIYVEICKREKAKPGTAKARPEPTLLFVHGFCLDMGTFHFQRKALWRQYRMVFFDQPGHGRSGRLAAGDYDLGALAATLRRVIEETTPTGPIVLVGHSMGAMAIMALAEQWPDLIRRRIVGVALINTSSGKLDEVTFGLPALLGVLRKPILPVLSTAGRLTPGAIDRARRASTDLFWLLTRKYGFGSPKPSPALVSYVERMISRTSVEIIAGYLKTLLSHSRAEALVAFADREVLVIAGDKDLFTPRSHGEEIVRLLPHAEFVAIADGGHLALLEHPVPVTEALTDLLSRVSRRER
ncbi:alpha/beta hydrolase [Longispora sp. NPDC051575]|uniref:alpha/beta fold hydrolase n=1 Tax=Longispora sp. NPDC051575 TaxID=3154943 RepID=UPI0034198EA7